MLRLSKIDYQILQILDRHGREPASLIAKQIRSNKDVVAYHIKKLEDAGIIMCYFPVLNMSRMGYHTSRIYFDLEEMNEKEEQEFLSFLSEDLQAGLIFRMDYPYRYGILLWTKSVYDIESALIRAKQKMGKKILRYNYTLFCRYHIYPKDYLFHKKHHDYYWKMQPQETEKYDEADYQILQQLSHNARISTVQIAQNLGVPQTTVSNKIKQLEKKKIILEYRAEINFIKLGYMNYFLEIYLEENHNLQEIEAWANTHPNTVWLQKVIGTCDIEVEVEVKDRVELEHLLNELRTRFRNIRKIAFWSQEYKKLGFMP